MLHVKREPPALEYSRAIRPFPVTPLMTRAAALHGRCAYLAEVMARLVESQAHGPVMWRRGLGELEDCLEALIEECQTLQGTCKGLYDSAEVDYERAVSAMVAAMRGLQAVGEPPPEVDAAEAPASLAA